jgi:ferredoxin-NADP reductase
MAYRYIVQSAERKEDILLLTLVPKHKRYQISFEPGQYATIGFTSGFRPTPMRCFSIVSTPTSGVLQFAMRIRGNFTQAAARLHPGSVVRVQGPFGDFTINPEYDQNIVMLAGGIGITPFLSMLRDATDRQLKLPVTLWYSNRSSTSVPFHAQLKRLAEQNPYLHIRFFNNDIEGKVTEAHLQQLQSNTSSNTTFFVCGPRGFSEHVQSALRAGGVHDSRVISESFAQSSSLSSFSTRFSINSLTYGLSAGALVLLTGTIMLLDIRQNLPKLTAAQVTSPSQSTSSDNTVPNTSSNSDNDNSASNSSSGDSSSTNSSTPTQTQPSYNNYQSPVSSVS